MKRWVMLVCLLAAGCGTWSCRSVVVTVEAQTLPITKTFAWDAPAVDATHGAADSYIAKLDGVQVGTPTTTSQSVTFTTLGSHVLSTTSVNLWGMSSPALLTVNVVPPGSPTNTRIQ